MSNSQSRFPLSSSCTSPDLNGTHCDRPADRAAAGRRPASSLPASGGLRRRQPLTQEPTAIGEEPCPRPSAFASAVVSSPNRNARWESCSAPTGRRTVGRLLFRLRRIFCHPQWQFSLLYCSSTHPSLFFEHHPHLFGKCGQDLRDHCPIRFLVYGSINVSFSGGTR